MVDETRAAEAMAAARERAPDPSWTSGPWFDDLDPGYAVCDAPSVTLTEGVAAVHQAIVGNALRLALDRHLSARVTGCRAPIVHPALVIDVAVGQSTALTERVVANLYYRNLIVHRPGRIGDTLRTTTAVVAMRENRPRPGRRRTGMALLRLTTRDQRERLVLEVFRCAMLPVRPTAAFSARDVDLDSSCGAPPSGHTTFLRDWNLAAYRAARQGPHFGELDSGMPLDAGAGDVVSCASELVRLTLNRAALHIGTPGDAPLVYGGHVIGLATTQLSRALPGLLYITAWRSCDHLAPVREGDLLRSDIVIERREPLAGGGGLVQLRSIVSAHREDGATRVLDWRPVAVFA